jgi:hypothetical protein
MKPARTHARTYRGRLGAALAALLCLGLVFSSAAQADYEQVGNFAQSGNGEQLWEGPSGMAANTNGVGGVEPGSVYASTEHRVSRYNAKGEIKEVWGWEVIASGPDLPNQVSTLEVNATSGTYELEAETARGVSDLTKGSTVLTKVLTETGALHAGDLISSFNASAFPPGTTVTSAGSDTIEVSAAATTSTGNAGAGGKLEGGDRQGFSTQETTAPIPYNATAAEVQDVLLALPAFEPGDVAVTGAPGSYEITFKGSYAGTPVGLLSTESTLGGGVPSSSATIKKTVSASATGFQRCRLENGDVCVAQEKEGRSAREGVGAFSDTRGLSVDQSTGYVYVVNGIFPGIREHNLIEVFSADGSKVITRFGDVGAEGENEKLHTGSARGIAVDEDGTIYLGDVSGTRQVMCFRPQAAGDYEHYVYCGHSQDLKTTYPAYLALDDAGHLYVAEQSLIEERSLAEPSAPALCTYLTHGQLHAMTVNPLTGEVFYFNSSGSDRSVHRLKPCDPAKGKFEEAQAKVKAIPATEEIHAMAFNSSLSWGPNRPAGILYAADEGFEEHGFQRGIGDIFAPAEVHSPGVESESVSNTRTTSTLLQARINPNGTGTRYVFQYLSESQYEANEPANRFAGAAVVPLGGGEIGGGSVGQVLAAVTGLAPDTAYRFRVVASSDCNPGSGEPCVADGQAQTFSTYPLFPPGLPDHRAYELVSPAQKHGGEVLPADPDVGSCNGCKPSGVTSGNVFPTQSSPDGEALAYEGQPFNPLEGAVNYDSYVARRTASGWQNTALLPALPLNVTQIAFDPGLDHGLLKPSTSNQLEIQDTSAPTSTTPLVAEINYRGTGELKLSYAGHSADFSRIFFGANDTLTEETAFAPKPPDPGVSKQDLYEWHDGQLALINVLPGNAAIAEGALFASISPDTNAVSEDGSRVYFEDEAGKLYVRDGGETTIQVNDPGHFLSATPDGSEVLLDDGCLYSLESESCTDLTGGKGGFKGLVGQSKDLSHLYFVDSEVLAANEGAGLDSKGNPQVAEAGKGNLYAWSEGTTSFIGQLLAEVKAGARGDSEDWASNPGGRTAEASLNGRFLAFASEASLTGYDNVGPCAFGPPDEHANYPVVPGPCNEAFLYDSASGRLVCASCNPTGEAPLGPTTLRRIAGSSGTFPQPRYLTDEGRLYFDTQDSLSSRDTNEGVEDVYEYSPHETGAQGTCEREAGCAFLISAGTEAVDSNLIAVDETGKNVFFDTRDRLALKDKDDQLDIYDAREGGGIAAESEIARAECQGENCQAPVSPPNDQTPASSTFEGAGNVKESPAAKKHSKKKHAKKHKKKATKHARTAKRNHGGAK